MNKELLMKIVLKIMTFILLTTTHSYGVCTYQEIKLENNSTEESSLLIGMIQTELERRGYAKSDRGEIIKAFYRLERKPLPLQAQASIREGIMRDIGILFGTNSTFDHVVYLGKEKKWDNETQSYPNVYYASKSSYHSVESDIDRFATLLSTWGLADCN
jgi:hypothetical protein